MKTSTRMKLAWKYRRPLWRYRRLLRHRYEIAALAATGLAITMGWLMSHERL